MLTILFVLPALLILFSGLIEKTSLGWLRQHGDARKKTVTKITEGV